jgi:hypothetical protein
MPLLGRGAMVFWHDIAAGDEEYNHWHAFEHMPERVGIPGFHRGRRYFASDGGPAYFNMYETESAATLTSEAYLARLNSPTPWTTASLPKFRNSNRTLCRVSASFGTGLGGALMTVQLAPAQGREAALRDWLTGLLAKLVTRPGIVGAHLLEADAEASRTETAEKALRDRADEVADWVVLVEALDRPALAALRQGELADAALAGHGAGELQNVALYRLFHVLSETELNCRRKGVP